MRYRIPKYVTRTAGDKSAKIAVKDRLKARDKAKLAAEIRKKLSRGQADAGDPPQN